MSADYSDAPAAFLKIYTLQGLPELSADCGRACRRLLILLHERDRVAVDEEAALQEWLRSAAVMDAYLEGAQDDQYWLTSMEVVALGLAHGLAVTVFTPQNNGHVIIAEALFQ